MQKEQLRRWWIHRRRRPLSSPEEDRIDRWLHRALQRFEAFGSIEDALEQHKIILSLSQDAHEVAGVRFRARLDMHQRRLTLFADALDELQPFCPDRKQLTEVILAHELFHLLCPDCPAPVQEATAHLFAARVAQIQDFPGLWDLAGKFPIAPE